MSRPPGAATLARKLAELDAMDHAALKQCYLELSGAPAPQRIGRKLLELAVAYELQSEHCRQSVQRLQRKLEALSAGKVTRKEVTRRSPAMISGGRLVREWRGRTYEVYVAEDGVYMDGQRYGSLTSAAFAITGSRWNGPRFFGLRSPRLNPTVRS